MPCLFLCPCLCASVCCSCFRSHPQPAAFTHGKGCMLTTVPSNRRVFLPKTPTPPHNKSSYEPSEQIPSSPIARVPIARVLRKKTVRFRVLPPNTNRGSCSSSPASHSLHLEKELSCCANGLLALQKLQWEAELQAFKGNHKDRNGLCSPPPNCIFPPHQPSLEVCGPQMPVFFHKHLPSQLSAQGLMERAPGRLAGLFSAGTIYLKAP